MKQYRVYIYIFLGIFGVSRTSLCEDECDASKTFLRPRSAIERDALFLGLNQYNFYYEYLAPHFVSCPETHHLMVGAFFQKSRDTKDMGRYFFPCEPKLSPGNQIATIGSSITINPTMKQTGAYFYYQNFSILCSKVWCAVKAAIYEETHSLHTRERVEFGDPDAPSAWTPLAFLESTDFRFGRFFDQRLKKVRFDDIQVIIGRHLVLSEQYDISAYITCIIPNGSRPRGKFLFEPLVGSDHLAFGLGCKGAVSVYKSDAGSLSLLADVSYIWPMVGTELRSLDMCVAPLSRYKIAFDPNNLTNLTPVINLSTVPLKVRPGDRFQLWMALHGQYYRWHWELGYNLWRRKQEDVKFKHESFEIKNENNLGIMFDGVFIPIAVENLNLASTCQPRALTSTAYGAVECDLYAESARLFVGFGASIEDSKTVSAFNQWSVWTSVGANF